MDIKSVFRWLWVHRNYLIIFITPFLILPLPLVIPTSEARCGYAIILMALYWCTECIPLAVTALLPVVLFPMMGIMESDKVCIEYLKDSNMLFIGGLLVAIAVEHWNLHKRIALRVLLIVGVRPALLMLGFMVVTAFLSMWISNTATTAMMLPISQAVLEQLSATEAEADEKEGQDHQAFELAEVSDTKLAVENTTGDKLNNSSDPETGIISASESRAMERKARNLHLFKAMNLCVCYSASIGGTATLTGTTPNLILKGQMDKIYPQNGNVINFASWFGFSFPNMVLTLLLSWLWLQCMYMGLNFKKSFGCGQTNEGDSQAYNVMKNEYKKLGRMSFAESAVLTVFILLVILWFTREPGFMPGWATELFNKDGDYVTDGTVAILMSMLFFIIPSRVECCSSQKNMDDDDDDESERVDQDAGKKQNTKNTPEKATTKWTAPPTLLNWQVVHERMPWNIVLLLGGGFALASASEESGLSKWLGESLSPLQSIPPFAIALTICLVVGVFTECSSNTATTTLFLPILASMATTIELHPLYVMIPCTLKASLAFMLPVATPPNAIAFSYGNLKVADMAKAGLMLNIIGILCISLSINTWGSAMFQLNTFPSWANSTSNNNTHGTP
nr:solute carrier family 13 member 2 isoform X1 [Misgurnus anguillicaudatus]